MEFDLFVIFVPLCFFTSFFYNKKDKFFKRFFKSLLHTFCIGMISLFFWHTFFAIKYDYQEKYNLKFLPDVFEFLSNVSLYFLAIVYNLVVLIAMKFDKD